MDRPSCFLHNDALQKLDKPERKRLFMTLAKISRNKQYVTVTSSKRIYHAKNIV